MKFALVKSKAETQRTGFLIMPNLSLKQIDMDPHSGKIRTGYCSDTMVSVMTMLFTTRKAIYANSV
jgi:hypothetical protein